jgi:predicted dehydrogenase
VVALVDIDRRALDQAGESLGVEPACRFVGIREALDAVDADLAILVIQPHLRREAIELATDWNMAILTEKPLAHRWDDALEIYRRCRATGAKLAVMQNYPHTNRIRTLKSVLDSGEMGRINYISARFAADYPIDSAGGAFRHQIPFAMLFEGVVHHFDQLRNLSGADGSRISGVQWNPPWSTFSEPPTALFLLEMTNGVACQLEINHVARGRQNGWDHELYRVECEHGEVALAADGVVRVFRHLGAGDLETTQVDPVAMTPSGHDAVIAGMLDWLDGGPPPESEIGDNIYTAAITFAAVEAVKTHQTIDIEAMMDAAGLAASSPRNSRTAGAS